jgi:adhesin/invasin
MRRAGLAALAALLGAAGCGSSDDGGDLFAGCKRESGTICTVAGTGVAGDGKDRLEPRKTQLYIPADIAFSPAGALTIVDWNNHRIRMLQPDGSLKIVAGDGELTPALITDEVGTRLNHPTDVTYDREGRMVIAAWHNSRIKRLDLATGMIEDIAGTGARAFGGDGGPAATAVFDLPASVVYDETGNLYVSDQANERVRCIDAMGIVRTVAGTGEIGFAGDDGPVLQAKFNLPRGQQGHPAAHITRDGAGNLYLADTLNNRIRKIDLRGDRITTIAGEGKGGFAGEDAPALAAQLAGPVDVAFGPDGDLYIADTDNDCIRRVHEGRISTVAGQCGVCANPDAPGCSCLPTDGACLGDGGPARGAKLRHPFGIAFDAAGNLFIADSLDHRIRVVFR